MLRLVTTSDGSHTLLNEELEEHYHSRHGALQESRHVFIEAGLKALKAQGSTSILEIGFGTGLNAFLTLLEGKETDYTAIEAFPLDHLIVSSLNYTEQLGKEADGFRKLHACNWDSWEQLNDKFRLRKIKTRLQEFSPAREYHLIYFDAFAPSVQPEMWSAEVFRKMYSALLPDGILVTYCAKGEVKRRMKAAGFEVEALPGPPGKREMTRGRRF